MFIRTTIFFTVSLCTIFINFTALLSILLKAYQRCLHQLSQQHTDQKTNLRHVIFRRVFIQFTDQGLTHFGNELAIDLENFVKLANISLAIDLHLIDQLLGQLYRWVYIDLGLSVFLFICRKSCICGPWGSVLVIVLEVVGHNILNCLYMYNWRMMLHIEATRTVSHYQKF